MQGVSASLQQLWQQFQHQHQRDTLLLHALQRGEQDTTAALSIAEHNLAEKESQLSALRHQLEEVPHARLGPMTPSGQNARQLGGYCMMLA